MPMEYFERRERALLGDRFDALYAAPSGTAARGVTVSALRTTPEALRAAAENGDLQNITGGQNNAAASQLNRVLSDPEAAKKLLSTPAAQKLFEALGGKK